MARSRGRGNRLRKFWEGGTFGRTAITQTQGLLTSFQLLESQPPLTVLRTRGNVLVFATPDATGDDDVVGLGVIVVSEQAANSGGTALPGPIGDPGDDWLWHQYVPLDAVNDTAADPQSITLNHRVEVDSKAMRRMSPNSRLVLVAEADTGEFSAINAVGGIRWLFGE